MFSGHRLSPELADEFGIVAVGGDLRPERLLQAYRHGVFPWYSEDEPIIWWCPDPRAIFELNGLYISRRLRRTIRQGKFQLTMNSDFAGVIRGCAEREEGTWLTPEMIAAYETLHRLGHAHSLECWYEGILAGGIYGVAIGGFFAGESMFTRVRDASKVALAALVQRLRTRGFQLLDVQYRTEHTISLGAIVIPRDEYLQRLKRALACNVRFVG